MKTQVQTTEKEIKYPCLMRTKSSDPDFAFIVLFTRSNCGMVVHSPDKNDFCRVGYYSTRWDPETFELVDETVLLKN